MVDGHFKVGVVLLNYRGLEDTLRCLDSLCLLTPASPLHILVVDNASGDSSVQALRDYAAKPPRPGNTAAHSIQVIANQQNLGFAEGNNIGIRLFIEQGVDFVWLLNNDTVVQSQSLDAMLSLMATDPKIGEVGSVLYDLDPDGSQSQRIQAWGGGSASVYTGHTSHALSPAPIDYITGASALLRVEALREIGYLDGRFFFQWEDVDLGFRLIKAGWKIAVAQESKVWHRGGASAGAFSSFRMQQHASGLVLFLRKHAPLGGWLALVTATPILGYYVWISIRKMQPGIFLAGLRGWLAGWCL